MKRLLVSAAVVALLCGCTTTSTPSTPMADIGPPPEQQEPAAPKPTAEEARAYVESAEKTLSDLSEYLNRVSWVRENFITYDTDWLLTKADAAYNEQVVKLAKGAARFNDVEVDAVTRRKLNLLRMAVTLPAPDRPGAAEELASVNTRMSGTYSTGKFTYKGKTYTLMEASNVMAESRDPVMLRAMWEGWMNIAAPMKSDYSQMVAISNEGARGLGFSDVGSLWRSNYDMTPEEFSAETDRLWGQMKPFYINLHCYTRRKLNEKYGDAVQPPFGPIRADLLGNMWAQDWSNIYDVVKPSGIRTSYSLDARLKAKKYTPLKMMQTGEAFYSSVGLAPLPETFWQRSLIVKPADREVACHASAWDLDNADDIRVKMCTEVNGTDFYTVHHELGHNYYQRAYKDQSFLFKDSAHDGFHEAVGDFIGLSSVTPTYLQQIGLIDKAPGAEEDIPFLLNMALQKIAFLPFSVRVDRWRWEVFSGKISEAEYNRRWWELARQYQGIEPPGVRPANAFDAGAKYHVPANVPYTRYFLAHVLQFQFQQAACEQAGWTGPLHRCSIYGNAKVGAKFNAMMEMGKSHPWPDALEAFTGTRQMDGSAVMAYFAPLNVWLTEQNKGHKCGWEV